MNEGPESDFAMCSYPSYEGDKLGITEELSCITVLEDRQDWFLDKGFASEKKGFLVWLPKRRLEILLAVPSHFLRKDPLRKVTMIHQSNVKYTATHRNFATR